MSNSREHEGDKRERRKEEGLRSFTWRAGDLREGRGGKTAGKLEKPVPGKMETPSM